MRVKEYEGEGPTLAEQSRRRAISGIQGTIWVPEPKFRSILDRELRILLEVEARTDSLSFPKCGRLGNWDGSYYRGRKQGMAGRCGLGIIRSTGGLDRIGWSASETEN